MDSNITENQREKETTDKEDEKFEDPVESFDIDNNLNNDNTNSSKADAEQKEIEHLEESEDKKEIIKVNLNFKLTKQ